MSIVILGLQGADVLAAPVADVAVDDCTAAAVDCTGAKSSLEQPTIETTTIDESARRLNIGAA